jgi:hypothetical protein
MDLEDRFASTTINCLEEVELHILFYLLVDNYMRAMRANLQIVEEE